MKCFNSIMLFSVCFNYENDKSLRIKAPRTLNKNFGLEKIEIRIRTVNNSKSG